MTCSKTVSNEETQTQNGSGTVLCLAESIVQQQTQRPDAFCLLAQTLRKKASPLSSLRKLPSSPAAPGRGQARQRAPGAELARTRDGAELARAEAELARRRCWRRSAWRGGERPSGSGARPPEQEAARGGGRPRGRRSGIRRAGPSIRRSWTATGPPELDPAAGPSIRRSWIATGPPSPSSARGAGASSAEARAPPAGSERGRVGEEEGEGGGPDPAGRGREEGRPRPRRAPLASSAAPAPARAVAPRRRRRHALQPRGRERKRGFAFAIVGDGTIWVEPFVSCT